jgi:hypothetical protein
MNKLLSSLILLSFSGLVFQGCSVSPPGNTGITQVENNFSTMALSGSYFHRKVETFIGNGNNSHLVRDLEYTMAANPDLPKPVFDDDPDLYDTVMANSAVQGRMAISPQFSLYMNSLKPVIPDPAALDGEFRVNAYTQSTQYEPVSAMDKDGNMVMAWTSINQEPDGGFGIYARKIDSQGNPVIPPDCSENCDPVTGEFLVNTVIPNYQMSPAVAIDNSDGSFVIAWQSRGQDANDVIQGYNYDYGIFAQRFESSGAKSGGEIPVNTTTYNNQYIPTVAAANGKFVIAWMGLGADGSGYDQGVFAQIFNNQGTREGDEFLVNKYTDDNQEVPRAAMDKNGNFIIVWQSKNQDGDGYGIYGKMYSSTGEIAKDEFIINSITANNQQNPSVAMNEDGNFVISWVDYTKTLISGDPNCHRFCSPLIYNNKYNVYARQFDNVGKPSGAEISFEPDNNKLAEAKVSISNAGHFALTAGNTDQSGIIAQFYSKKGKKAGPLLNVNTDTVRAKNNPVIAMNDNRALITWVSKNQDGSEEGIYGQRFTF